LKHLDRHLQRFGGRIDSLRERVDRLSDEEEGDLTLAIESLHRETVGLRAEIREHLSGGKRKSAEMMEYAEEAWDQLRESLAELKENFEPEKTARTRSEGRRRPDDNGEDEDGEWLGDEGPRDNGDG
jgi:predicted  nucleic acid-binding Zn-ribbon protein